MRATPVHRWLLAPVVAVILLATLYPAGGEESTTWLGCVVCGERGTADFVVNVLLFVPLGAVLAAAGIPLRRCILFGAALSAAVELTQLFVPGRDPSLGDVVANALGSGIGAAIVANASSWLRPPRARANRMSWISSGLAAVVCLVTGWLLTPAPPQLRYVALWTPNIAGLEWYRGRVREVTIDGIPIPSSWIAKSDAVRELLSSSDSFSVHVHATAGPHTSRLGGLFAIYDQNGHEVLLLGPDREDLVFRLRLRAATWRLDQPDIRAPKALQAVTAGDELDVAVQDRRGHYTLTVNSSADIRTGLTVGVGWALLMYPDGLAEWLRGLLSVAWMGVLWLPAGFWARTWGDAAVIGAALAIGLIGAAATSALIATPFLQWAAAGLGLATGAFAHLAIGRETGS